MGSRYLTDMADVLRRAGITVQEEPGWQSRARSSGGFNSGLPNTIMCHHTASGPGSDGQSDVNYMTYSADAKPIANLYLSRTGKVWVMAGGATNTNGSGGPLGPVPVDSMNSSAIGIEAANGGTGEPWPQVQQEVYARMCAALAAAYGISNSNIRDHQEWAPGRKCDITGPARWGTG